MFPSVSLLACGFMLASGAAALMYQVVWARLLSLSIGSTSAAIGIVLAAFFLGLALGAWLSERWVGGVASDIKFYLTLEVVIGLAGLALLPILLNLDVVVAQWGTVAHATGVKFGLVMLLLIIPTTAMGATFPVMLAFLDQGQQSGRQLGHLYALNTAGGVLGAVLSGFIFIPKWGLDGSTYLAAGLNFAVVILGFGFMKTLSTDKLSIISTATIPPPMATTAIRNRALIVLFGTGMVALACEVAWTKYLAIYLHTTLYGFAAILAIFLIGLAAGAWAIKFWLDRLTQFSLWIAGGLLALGISLVLTQVGLSALPDIHALLTDARSPLSMGVKYALIFGLLFPATFIFGALFSLNLRIASSPTDSLHHPVGNAYAINTLGGIIGAIGAGLWMIPNFGTNSVLKVTAAIPLLLAFMFFVPSPVWNAGKGKRFTLALTASLLLGTNALMPSLDFRPLIRASAYYFDTNRNLQQPFLFVQEGNTGIVSVATIQPQLFMLQKNGLPEAIINSQRPYFNLTESMLGLVPYLLHEAPRSAFVVGFGGGTTTQALVATELESIRLIELDPVMIEAVRAIHQGSAIPALQDPRVELVIDDARQRLLLEDRQYDLIISQPSHPWLAGSGKMFSQEFFQLARSRLTGDGIYSQWLNLFNMDATTLRSILQAFYTEFPYGMSMIVFNESGLLLLGSQQPIQLDYTHIQRQLMSPRIQAALAKGGIQQPEDLLRYFALSREEALQAASNIRPNTDLNLMSEVRLATLSESPTGKEGPYALLRQYARLDLAAYFDDQLLEQRYQELEDLFQRLNSPERARMAQSQRQRLGYLGNSNASGKRDPSVVPRQIPR